jgi:alanyl-tRNA synthetase
MNARQLREKYFHFFEERGHQRIPSAPLIPENDPTVLFTPAGMQPLVPYLLGEPHPMGKRLVNVQRCIRTNDVEEVGDNSHLTFFEMLGNWSLGDYFKRESLTWSHEFLSTELGIDPGRLAVTVFAGDKAAPRDQESADIWHALGIPSQRIFFLPKADNWWGPVGLSGPCGPDSEIFFDTGKADHTGCRPGCSCGKWFEIWNNVFMQYNQLEPGKYELLSQVNVDTGMGVDRTVAVLNGFDDIFLIETIWPLVQQLQELSARSYADNPLPFRVISDHIRAAAMAIADGGRPSNVESGYIIRRLIRRSVVYAHQLGIEHKFFGALSATVMDIFEEVYPDIGRQREIVAAEMEREETRFQATLERGLKQYNRVSEITQQEDRKEISGEDAFDLFQTYGFPLSITVELAEGQGLQVDDERFGTLFHEHQEISRRGMDKKFRGGLADDNLQSTCYHTTTHLLHQALRLVLGDTIQQKGSNITPERLRFDFSYGHKLTPQQVQEVEQIVNRQIERDLTVTFEVLSLNGALEQGALAFFGEKYGEQVKVYTIGDFSKEVCGGPHVDRTGLLGHFRIIKQEAVGQGVRRIRAVLE